MNRFSYTRPGDVAEAVREAASEPGARFIAGGTNLIDLMKYNVERPSRLVDINRWPGLDAIETTPNGGSSGVYGSEVHYGDCVTLWRTSEPPH
jgi:xanthine dehydrogenase YagS FAD-binding subunit